MLVLINSKAAYERSQDRKKTRVERSKIINSNAAYERSEEYKNERSEDLKLTCRIP